MVRALYLYAPFCAMGEKVDFLYLIATMLSRHGIVVIKFTKSRKLPHHRFYLPLRYDVVHPGYVGYEAKPGFFGSEKGCDTARLPNSLYGHIVNHIVNHIETPSEFPTTTTTTTTTATTTTATTTTTTATTTTGTTTTHAAVTTTTASIHPSHPLPSTSKNVP